MEEIRLYNILMVDKTVLVKYDETFILHVYNHFFKTDYHNMIGIKISLEEWEQLKKTGKTFINKKKTPIIFSIRKQAVEHINKIKGVTVR